MRLAKKTKIYRCGLFAIVFFCLTLIGSLVTLRNPAVSADAEGYEIIYIGDVIEAEDYTLTHSGGSVQAEGLRAVYPSGGLYGGEGFAVEQAGVYEITYFANVNNNRIEETKRYMALRKPQDLIVSHDGAAIGYGKYEVESPYTMKKETYGAKVVFKAGTSIDFTTTIRTEKLTSSYNILDLIVMPSVFRETDFERLSVVVTDKDDPNNFVTVTIDSSNVVDGNGQVSYVRAGANGQQEGGYEGARYHTSYYGTSIEHSFRGFGREHESRDTHTISELSLTVSIDNESKKVYCGPADNVSDGKSLINDLDDAMRYKTNPWGGFTSDEVTVKVISGKFIKATGTVIFKSFGDFNLAEDIEDTVAPNIALNYDDNKALPVATVGKAFPMIGFTAKDALDTKVKTSVFVYYLDDGKKINVSHDGTSFVPQYAGEYEVVYRAEDYSGNVATKSVIINAVEKNPDIFIAIDQPEVSAVAYSTVTIKEASQVYAFGGNGNLHIERTVYSPKGQALDVEDTLLLTEMGDYKVVYKVTDYLDNVEYGVVTIHSFAMDKPSFIETPDFDKAFIQGARYDLPQPFVVETVNNEVVEVACKVYVNGSLMNGNFTASGTSAEIKYVAEGASGTSEWSVTVPVVDTEKGKYQSKYFYTEGELAITDEKDYVALAFTGTSATEFIKALYSRGFSFAFNYDPALMNFGSMTVVLTDGLDRTLSVSFHFTYDAAANLWYLQLGNAKDKVSYFTSKNIFSLSLASNGKDVLDSSGVGVASIKTFDNGEPFNGFSNNVYFRMEFDGVTDLSSIYLTNLCNQVMGYKKSSIDKAKDEIKPVIFLDGEFQIRQKLGQEAYIPTAFACDVLGEINEFTVTVKKEGTVLASGPATEALKVVLNEAGNYTVVYYAKDSNGKYAELSYIILVADETAPTLSVNGSLESEYKVGAQISIPEYSATDNGENCYVQVELILPNNEVRLLQYNENGEVTSLLKSDSKLYNSSFKVNENTFVAELVGKYVLRFVAYDEYYNVVVHEIVFNVK